jgi:hypothetical protein
MPEPSPLVEFEPPDGKPEESMMRLQVRIAFARQIEKSATNVLTDLQERVLDVFPDVFPVRASVHNDLENHAVQLMMRRFDERNYNHDPFPYLLRSDICFDQRDSNFPALLAGLKIDEAEKDIRQNPDEYDQRCRYLGDLGGILNGSIWKPLAAADESCHPKLLKVRKEIEQWADDNYLVTADDWFCAIAFSTLQDWSQEEFDGMWSLGHGLPGAPFRIPVCPLEGFREDYRADLVNRQWYLDVTFKRWLAGVEKECGFRSLPPHLRVKARESYEKTIAKHREDVEEVYEKHRWKRSKYRKKFTQHLEWAIRFQVKGESYMDIASELTPGWTKLPSDHGKDESTVRKAVDELLDLADITRRSQHS